MRRAALAFAALAAAALAAVPAGAAVPGALIGSYGSCGVSVSPPAAQRAGVVGTLPLAGGALSVGSTEDAIVTMKLTGDGAIDPAYGTNGVASAQVPGFTKPSYAFDAVAPQGGGKVLVAGEGREQGAATTQAVLARLNADGSLDTGFGSGGRVIDALPGGKQSWVAGVDVDSAGRVLVVGMRDDQLVVARYGPDGAPDSGWGAGGVAQIAFPDTKKAFGLAVRALPDGTVLAGGQADEQFALVRLKTDGTLDPAFGTGGTSLDSPPASARIDVLEPLPDGRILAAGAADDINGQELALARFTAAGRPDPSFAGSGFTIAGGVGRPNQILRQPDGSLLVTGMGFARFSADGVLDGAFGVRGVFATGEVGDVILQPDGSAIGVAARNRIGMSVERYALSGPALAAIDQQSAMCNETVATKLVKQLVRRAGGAPYGGVSVSLDLLEPTTATWSATARAGGHTYRLRSVRVEFDIAAPDSFVIPLSRRARAKLLRANAVHLRVNGRDAGGHTVSLDSDLTP